MTGTVLKMWLGRSLVFITTLFIALLMESDPTVEKAAAIAHKALVKEQESYDQLVRSGATETALRQALCRSILRILFTTNVFTGICNRSTQDFIRDALHELCIESVNVDRIKRTQFWKVSSYRASFTFQHRSRGGNPEAHEWKFEGALDMRPLFSIRYTPSQFVHYEYCGILYPFAPTFAVDALVVCLNWVLCHLEMTFGLKVWTSFGTDITRAFNPSGAHRVPLMVPWLDMMYDLYDKLPDSSAAK